MRDRRYEAVLHLVTAADGAEKFYNFENEARSESIEESKALDKKLINAWVGHPHFSIIQNQPGKTFQDKIDKTLSTVLNFIGLPSPSAQFVKYLLIQDETLEFQVPDDVKTEYF